MTSFVVQHFDSLKSRVLAVGGYKSISPSDCKVLSLLIYKKTNHQLSETTLKRVYGFAYSKFKPSLFTLDAMAQYCDYDGWANYCETAGSTKKKTQATDVCWDNIRQNANKITNFTLQALKNRSGIPYGQTIKREFIDDHMDAFTKDDYNATVIAAPAGYGKTIGLCHWVEEKMAISNEGGSNDIVLFFSSSALINVFISGKDINEWLLSLLGYGTEEDFSTLLDSNRKHLFNFYLIIDGLDEHMFKNNQFHMLLDQTLEVLSFYKFYTNFKLVLTMRSATWLNHRHEIGDLNKWFEGFLIDDDMAINVPLFNINEIKELCTNINPTIRNFIGIEIAENFNHPLYFQFYYKQHKDDFSLNNVDHVCIYELISTFILNKIYLSSQSAEKMLIIRALTEYMDPKNEVYSVDKLKLNDLMRQYPAAYNDLLGIGFLRELNKSAGLNYSIVIEFCNTNFLNYSLAIAMLFNNNNLFDEKLIDTINNLYHDERKVQIIKWCLLYAIKNGQQKSFELLAKTQLTAREKSEVIIFMGDMFDKSRFPLNKTESMVQYFNQDCSDALFDYFFGIEFISSDYTKTLHTLLRFDLSAKKKIMIYTALATIAIMQLDVNRLENYMANLKSFPQEELQTFIVNPLNCLETLYYYLKYGIIKKDAFAEITSFYFNPPVGEDTLKHNNTNDVVSLLAIYTLMVCKNPVKSLRFINKLNKVYKRDTEYGKDFNYLLQLLSAKNYYELGKAKEGRELFDKVAEVYERNKESFTPFMKVSFYTLKIKMSVHEQHENETLHQNIRSFTCLADEAGLKLVRINVLIFLLTHKASLNLTEAFVKQAYYDFTKIMRGSGFREESLIDNNVTVITR